VADGDASTCEFVEFSSKWRTAFSHLRGGSYNRTVVHELGRRFGTRAIVEALTVLGLRGWLEVELDEHAEQLIDELADV
jgi:hypothetical protein